MKKKREMNLLRFHEYDAIADHLAAMAAKGWQLESISSFGWVYRQAEPRKLTYAVTYFAAASEFDPGPGEAQLTYMDFCRQAGWEPVARWAQMQIFVTDRPDPVPLETDEHVKLDTIHRAMKKNYLVGMWVLLAVSLLQMVFQVYQYVTNPIFWLLSTQYVVTIVWLTLGLYSGWQLWQYRRWYRGSRASVEAGGACLPGRAPGGRAVEIAVLAVDGVALLLLLRDSIESDVPEALAWGVGIVAAALVLSFGAKHLMKLRKVPAKYSRIITMVIIAVTVSGLMALMVHSVLDLADSRRETEDYYEIGNFRWYLYHDPIPLRVEDLMETDYEYYSTELLHQGSLLLARDQCTQLGVPNGEDAPDLRYEIMDVRAGFLYDLCLEDYLDLEFWNQDDGPEYRFVEVDPAPWQAETVYRKQWGEEWMDTYVICWEDRIVEFQPDWELTEAQIAAAAEKLMK